MCQTLVCVLIFSMTRVVCTGDVDSLVSDGTALKLTSVEINGNHLMVCILGSAYFVDKYNLPYSVRQKVITF